MGSAITDIDRDLKQLAENIIDGRIDTNDIATLTYYGMRLMSAVEKLERPMLNTSFIYQMKLMKQIQRLKMALAIIKAKIIEAQGDGCIYFSDLAKKNKDLKNNPIVKELDKHRMHGMMLIKAIKITSGDTGMPELAVSNFIKNNEVDYPKIDETSMSYQEGQKDARKLVTARVQAVGDKMYESQKDFLRLHPKQDKDSLSYIAGFSNVASTAFSRSFLDQERMKGNFLANVDKYI